LTSLRVLLFKQDSSCWDATSRCLGLKHGFRARDLEQLELKLMLDDPLTQLDYVKAGNRAQVKLDDKTVFDGVIHERKISQSDRVECEITAYTSIIRYERYIVYRLYQAGTKAGEIIRDLGKLIDEEIPVNLSGVEDGDALLSPWRIENQTALKVMRSVARGVNYWLRMKPCLSYLSFDGVDDYVEMASTPSTSVTELTVMAWAYVRSFNKGTFDTSTPIISDWNTYSPGSQRGYLLRTFYHANTDTLRWFFTVCDGENPVTVDYDTLSFDEFQAKYAGRWLNVAGVFKAENHLKLYLNGGLVNQKSTTLTQMTPETSTPTWIARTGINAAYLNGSIAQILIYTRALPDSEIQHNHQNPMNPTTDGLLLWLNFDDGSGDKLHDRSDNGNHGTVYGATWSYEVYPEHVNSMLLEFKPKVVE